MCTYIPTQTAAGPGVVDVQQQQTSSDSGSLQGIYNCICNNYLLLQ